MCTTTCKSTTHASRIHLAALGSVPLTRGLGVGSDLHTGENGFVFRCLHQISDLAGHVNG